MTQTTLYEIDCTRMLPPCPGQVYEWRYHMLGHGDRAVPGTASIVYQDDEERWHVVAENLTEQQAESLCRAHNLQFHDMELVDEQTQWSDKVQGELFGVREGV